MDEGSVINEEEILVARRPEKTLLAQVRTLDPRSKLYKQKLSDIMNRIVSTIASWELFSDDQISDANQALKLLQNQQAQNPEELKPMVRSLIRLVGNQDVPLHIRY